MIRSGLLVLGLYLVCCAMAFGQTPSREAGQAMVSDRNGRPMVQQSNEGSLIADSLTRKVDPGQLKYSDVSVLALPEVKPREVKKHDLVTIIVAEDSQSSSKGTTDLKKNADLDLKVDSYVQLNKAKLTLQGVTPAVTPELKGEAARNFKGDATVDRQDTFTARIGARVIDVKPNGNLVIEARKHIKTDEEEQDFVLTGECRAVDLSPDNTVLSNTLHDLDVHKVTKGAARDTTKRGWVPRLLDFVNPF